MLERNESIKPYKKIHVTLPKGLLSDEFVTFAVDIPDYYHETEIFKEEDSGRSGLSESTSHFAQAYLVCERFLDELNSIRQSGMMIATVEKIPQVVEDLKVHAEKILNEDGKAVIEGYSKLFQEIYDYYIKH